MEALRDGSTHRIHAFGRPMSVKMEPAYKVDEGYSEETKSQEGTDSPIPMDADDENAILGQFPLGSGLQDAVLALGENERKGKFLCHRKYETLCSQDLPRNCIYDTAEPEGIIDGLSCGSIMASVSQRSCGVFSPGDRLAHFLLPSAPGPYGRIKGLPLLEGACA